MGGWTDGLVGGPLSDSQWRSSKSVFCFRFLRPFSAARNLGENRNTQHCIQCYPHCHVCTFTDLRLAHLTDHGFDMSSRTVLETIPAFSRPFGLLVLICKLQALLEVLLLRCVCVCPTEWTSEPDNHQHRTATHNTQ